MFIVRFSVNWIRTTNEFCCLSLAFLLLLFIVECDNVHCTLLHGHMCVYISGSVGFLLRQAVVGKNKQWLAFKITYLDELTSRSRWEREWSVYARFVLKFVIIFYFPIFIIIQHEYIERETKSDIFIEREKRHFFHH